jgi:hypothetical protein
MIYWDPITDQIVLKPILASRSQLLAQAEFGSPALAVNKASEVAASYVRRYISPTPVIDFNTGRSFRSLGGESFMVIPGSPPVLVGAFVVDAGKCQQCISRIQVMSWALRTTRSRLRVESCYLPKPLMVSVSGNQDFSQIAVRAWRSSKGHCYGY